MLGANLFVKDDKFEMYDNLGIIRVVYTFHIFLGECFYLVIYNL